MNSTPNTPEEVEEFFAHFGKKGMKWGQKTTQPVGPLGTQKSRAEAYKKAPTAREFFLGKGKTLAERKQSRNNLALASSAELLTGLGLHYAASKISRSHPSVASGMAVAGNILGGAGLIGSVYGSLAGVADYTINGLTPRTKRK